MSSCGKTYLYLVYESFFRYKDKEKFFEIDLTTDQLDIKEKYIDKDKYKMEFFEVASEYASKVLKYVQDKHIKSSFPIIMLKGELQSSCSEFIKKCNDLMMEKKRDNNPSSHQPLLGVSQQQQQQQQHKAIALIGHRQTGDITVVCNSNTVSPQEFLTQVLNHVLLHVCQHAVMLAAQVDLIISSFQHDFQGSKSANSELSLTWYKVSEHDITQWLAMKSYSTSPPAPLPAPPPLAPFNPDDYINNNDYSDEEVFKADNPLLLQHGGKKRRTN